MRDRRFLVQRAAIRAERQHRRSAPAPRQESHRDQHRAPIRQASLSDPPAALQRPGCRGQEDQTKEVILLRILFRSSQRISDDARQAPSRESDPAPRSGRRPWPSNSDGRNRSRGEGDYVIGGIPRSYSRMRRSDTPKHRARGSPRRSMQTECAGSGARIGARWKGAIRIAKVGGTVAARASHDRRLNGTSRVDLQARTMLTAASIAILQLATMAQNPDDPARVGTAGDGHLPGGSRRSQPSPRMDSRRSKACNCRGPRGCEVRRDREARGSRTRLRGVASLAAGREGPWLPPALRGPGGRNGRREAAAPVERREVHDPYRGRRRGYLAAAK